MGGVKPDKSSEERPEFAEDAPEKLDEAECLRPAAPLQSRRPMGSRNRTINSEERNFFFCPLYISEGAGGNLARRRLVGPSETSVSEAAPGTLEYAQGGLEVYRGPAH